MLLTLIVNKFSLDTISLTNCEESLKRFKKIKRLNYFSSFLSVNVFRFSSNFLFFYCQNHQNFNLISFEEKCLIFKWRHKFEYLAVKLLSIVSSKQSWVFIFIFLSIVSQYFVLILLQNGKVGEKELRRKSPYKKRR